MFELEYWVRFSIWHFLCLQEHGKLAIAYANYIAGKGLILSQVNKQVFSLVWSVSRKTTHSHSHSYAAQFYLLIFSF